MSHVVDCVKRGHAGKERMAYRPGVLFEVFNCRLDDLLYVSL